MCPCVGIGMPVTEFTVPFWMLLTLQQQPCQAMYFTLQTVERRTHAFMEKRLKQAGQVAQRVIAH